MRGEKLGARHRVAAEHGPRLRPGAFRRVRCERLLTLGCFLRNEEVGGGQNDHTPTRGQGCVYRHPRGCRYRWRSDRLAASALHRVEPALSGGGFSIVLGQGCVWARGRIWFAEAQLRILEAATGARGVTCSPAHFPIFLWLRGAHGGHLVRVCPAGTFGSKIDHGALRNPQVAASPQNLTGSDIPSVTSGLSSVTPNAPEKVRNTSRARRTPTPSST